MAVFRQVHITFWTDTKISDEMSFEEKYLMLYLLTNPHTNQIGCYEISIKQISIESGLQEKDINKMLIDFEDVYKIIKYCKANKELLVLNWYKYNWSFSPKVKQCIEKELKYIKSEEFIKYLCKVSEDYGYNLTNHSLSIPYPNNNNKRKEKNNNNNNNNKEYFETFWKLYPKKESKLKTEVWFTNNKLEEETFNKILSKLEIFKKSKQWENIQYVPHPITWLNQKRYEDELAEEKSIIDILEGV
jgi:DNA-directed RNA polymerase subunit F